MLIHEGDDDTHELSDRLDEVGCRVIMTRLATFDFIDLPDSEEVLQQLQCCDIPCAETNDELESPSCLREAPLGGDEAGDEPREVPGNLRHANACIET